VCFSSSLALHFSNYSFLVHPTCHPGWPAPPCACNGLWLLSHMAVFSNFKNVKYKLTNKAVFAFLCHLIDGILS
jgi:hypothetical protein